LAGVAESSPEVGGPFTSTVTDEKAGLSELPTGNVVNVNRYELPGERLLGLMLRVNVTFWAT
jgi:hypothetical protein